jgi:hypothetical protein
MKTPGIGPIGAKPINITTSSETTKAAILSILFIGILLVLIRLACR